MVLTVSFVLSPVIGLVCHRRRRSCLRRLDAGVEASGPHDFAVHRIPPHVRDGRERPSVGQDRIAIFLFLPGRQAKFGKSEIESKMPLIRNGGESVKMDLGAGWRVHRIPRPTSVTIANTPLWGIGIYSVRRRRT